MTRSFPLRLLLAAALFLSILPPAAAAASSTKVSVKIADYSVHLNGKTIDNTKAKYPIITYKSITYFPMTWDYANALGLSVNWSSSDGLSLYSGGYSEPLIEEKSGSNKAGAVYKAAIASYPIKVNDVSMNNAKETYPLLVFRDITYFPMTWRFTYELFGWETQWDSKTGFHIWGKQHPVFSGLGIIDDDDNYLYVYSNYHGLIAINKALNGTYRLLTENEKKTVYERNERRNEAHRLALYRSDIEGLNTVDGQLYYKDQSLIDLQPYQKQVDDYLAAAPYPDQSSVHTSASMLALNDELSLMTVWVHYLTHIPAPYTPTATFSYIIANDKAVPIEGFNETPTGLIRNTDGSFWLYNSAPAADMLTTTTFDMRAHLAYIATDGTPKLMNNHLNAADVEFLKHEDDESTRNSNSIIVKASSDRLFGDKPLATDGFFRLGIDGKVGKMSDYLFGTSYVDQQGELYTVNWNTNTITNSTAKRSYRWRDYELKPQ